MADYYKLTVLSRYSESSDYSDPAINQAQSQELTTPTTYIETQVLSTTGGTTLSTANFTSLKSLVLTNKDSTNYVTVVYRTGAGAATNQTMKLLAGETCVLKDVTAATNPTLTANTASVEVAVVAVGT